MGKHSRKMAVITVIALEVLRTPSSMYVEYPSLRLLCILCYAGYSSPLTGVVVVEKVVVSTRGH